MRSTWSWAWAAPILMPVIGKQISSGKIGIRDPPIDPDGQQAAHYLPIPWPENCPAWRLRQPAAYAYPGLLEEKPSKLLSFKMLRDCRP